MKNFYLTFILILSVFYVNAQQDIFTCATEEPSVPDPSGIYSGSSDLQLIEDGERIVLNIYFWGINRPNGQNDFPNRPKDVLQAVANLNILYNQFNIFFKYRGYKAIDSPVLANDPNGYYILENIYQYFDLKDWAETSGYKREDSYNVYAFGWSGNAGGISAFNDVHCGVSSGHLDTHLILHEVGHSLNLGHTRSSSGVGGERVTRDPTNTNFNANTHGDKVVDTAANPGYRDGDAYPFVNLETCVYENDGSQVDYNNEAYVPAPEDVRNIMGNAYPCMDASSPLSIGQGIRAREALENDIYEKFAPIRTSLSSLYEPYTGRYFVLPEGSGQTYRPLFQPGFDYTFIGCCCDYPEPSDYYDTSFNTTTAVLGTISKYENNFQNITHPNHSAIRIDFPVIGNTINKPRKCYDNWNGIAQQGRVVHFKDGIFNTNINTFHKDSVQINNPNLIEDLEPGLYKIEKEYGDGSNQENIIYKN